MSEAPKSNYTLPLLLSLFLALGLYFGGLLSHGFSNNTEKAADVQKLEDILDLLENRYVDKVDKDRVFEETISEMLHKLDPQNKVQVLKKEIKEGVRYNLILGLQTLDIFSI